MRWIRPLLDLLPPTLHPMVVHFPIALLFVAALFAVLGRTRRFQALEEFVRPLLLLALLSAVVAVAAGEVAEAHATNLTPAGLALLRAHKAAGVWTALLVGLAWLASFTGVSGERSRPRGEREERRGRARRRLPTLSLALLLAATALVAYTGFLGGRLVYDHGVGVAVRSQSGASAPRLDSPRRDVRNSHPARRGAGGGGNSPPAGELGLTIWQSTCSGCHGAPEPFGRNFVAQVGRETLIQFIANNMPPGNPISLSQAKAVVTYLERLP